MEMTLEGIRQKTQNANKLAGYLLLISGLVFGIFGARDLVKATAAWQQHLSFFIMALSAVFIICGIVALKISKKKN
jgi:hypothetical protein